MRDKLLRLYVNEISTEDVVNEWNSSCERYLHLLEEDIPKSGIPVYEYHKEKIRYSMLINRDSEDFDVEQIYMFLILDKLIEKSKTYKNTDHYKTEFISTVAKMTFCFKRIDNYPISKLLALWLVPAKVKACKNEYMTEDRIEYVLNLAKQNRIDVNHF